MVKQRIFDIWGPGSIDSSLNSKMSYFGSHSCNKVYYMFKYSTKYLRYFEEISEIKQRLTKLLLVNNILLGLKQNRAMRLPGQPPGYICPLIPKGLCGLAGKDVFVLPPHVLLLKLHRPQSSSAQTRTVSHSRHGPQREESLFSQEYTGIYAAKNLQTTSQSEK